MAVTILIAAAGRGERLGKGKNKTLIAIDDKPILAHTIDVFQNMDEISEIVIVTGKNEIDETNEIVRSFGFSKVKSVVCGGNTRQQSVMNGLNAVTGDIVAIHDGARPFITPDIVRASIAAAKKHGAAVTCIPVTDTIKIAHDTAVKDTPKRSTLFAAQTPQSFETSLIRKAYENAAKHDLSLTDDASAVEALGKTVAITPGSAENIKITTAHDLEMAQMKSTKKTPRIGYGIDVHKLTCDRKLILGGVEIPHKTGLLGHSDADVLLHAICDALLGAAACGDIGKHFPDTDEKYKSISSIKLLSHASNLICEMGFEISNIDATLTCQKPKLAPYIDKMRQNIADTCKIDISRINVKATTTEKLGYEGREEGITAHAVCVII